jgi:hypothetical protein
VTTGCPWSSRNPSGQVEAVIGSVIQALTRLHRRQSPRDFDQRSYGSTISRSIVLSIFWMPRSELHFKTVRVSIAGALLTLDSLVRAGCAPVRGRPPRTAIIRETVFRGIDMDLRGGISSDPIHPIRLLFAVVLSAG